MGIEKESLIAGDGGENQLLKSHFLRCWFGMKSTNT